MHTRSNIDVIKIPQLKGSNVLLRTENYLQSTKIANKNFVSTLTLSYEEEEFIVTNSFCKELKI